MSASAIVLSESEKLKTLNFPFQDKSILNMEGNEKNNNKRILKPDDSDKEHKRSRSTNDNQDPMSEDEYIIVVLV